MFCQDSLISNLLRLIQTMRPPPKSSTSKGENSQFLPVLQFSHLKTKHGEHLMTSILMAIMSGFFSHICWDLCCTGSHPVVKPKSEKDKLKDLFPALCRPDNPVTKVEKSPLRLFILKVWFQQKVINKHFFN